MILPDEKQMKEIRGTFWAEPSSTWDPVSGYKWLNHKNRILRVAHGEIVGDSKYQYNNYNQHSSFDYNPKKTSENIYRMVVLGDSFTNDILLRTAWPETLHHLLNSRKEFGIDFEVYSFSTDGGGLVNWYSTFTELIDKDFDYDAVIIADWGDDLYRPWVMSDCNETEFRWVTTSFKDRPKTRGGFEKLLPEAQVLADIKSDEEIEELVQKLKKNANPAVVDHDDYYSPDLEKPPSNYVFSKENFIERYDEMRYNMLEEIIETSKSKNKSVIYSTLPTRQGVIAIQKDGNKLMAQAQGEGLCKHFGIHYFDGFEVFKEIASQALVDFYWLKYDGHWNLGASMHYAMKLAEWLFRKKIFLERPKNFLNSKK